MYDYDTITKLLGEFEEKFDVSLANVHSDDEQPEYKFYDFVDVGGHHVVTVDTSTLIHMLDIADGHFPPYEPNTPTHKWYREFMDTYQK